MAIFTFLPMWVWISISAIFFAVGELLSKKFALSPGWSMFALIIVVDVISVTTWLPAIFEKNQLSITGVIWSLASIMATIMVGMIVFGEEMTLIQLLGCIAAVVSITLLSL